jgi:hypothetical protein
MSTTTVSASASTTKPFYPLSELSEFIPIGAATIQSLASEGKIRAITFGKRLFVTSDEIQRLLREGTGE